MNEPSSERIPDETLERQLVRWLPDRRWFAAKGTTISAVRILLRHELMAVVGFSAEHLLVSVEFEAGPPQVYQIPLGSAVIYPGTSSRGRCRTATETS